MALTVQNIIDAVSLDARQVLGTTGGDATILLDWVDRIHKELLRKSRWSFTLSGVKHFLTEKGQIDYWIGATGSEPTGAVDTGLNITDMGSIKSGSVFDRSNRRALKSSRVKLLDGTLVRRDGSYEMREPRVWVQDVDTPFLMQIYPAPNNNNNFQFVPRPPHLESAVSGALSARTYFVRITYEDSLGNETTVSDSNEQFIPASSLLKVKSPNPQFTTLSKGSSLVGYHVYANEEANGETKQTTSAVAFGTDFDEPSGGLISGDAIPSSNTIAILDGYLIEFRYWRERVTLTAVGDTLQVPERYKDIVVAGVNYLTEKYLRGTGEEASVWYRLYMDGQRQMVRDEQLFEGEDSYIRPDPASLGSALTAGGDPVQDIFFGVD